jgi:hypothetical protein
MSVLWFLILRIFFIQYFRQYTTATTGILKIQLNHPCGGAQNLFYTA